MPSLEQNTTSFKRFFRHTIFEPTLDKVLQEFESRLVVHADFFSALAYMDPQSSKFMDKDMDAASVHASHYPTLFDDLVLEDLKNQMSTAKGFFYEGQ